MTQPYNPPTILMLRDREDYEVQEIAEAVWIARVLDRGVFVLCQEPKP